MTFAQQKIDTTASANVSTTVKITDEAGVAAKLGWIVAPRSMIYGKIGAEWARIKVSNSVNASNTVTVTNLSNPNTPETIASFLTQFRGFFQQF